MSNNANVNGVQEQVNHFHFHVDVSLNVTREQFSGTIQAFLQAIHATIAAQELVEPAAVPMNPEVLPAPQNPQVLPAPVHPEIPPEPAVQLEVLPAPAPIINVEGDPNLPEEDSNEEDVMLCIVCQDRQAILRLVPCNHLFCEECPPKLMQYHLPCSVCRAPFHDG